MDDGPVLPPPAALGPGPAPDPISRPSSTSTLESAPQTQQMQTLPGIASLAAATSEAISPQPRPPAIVHHPMYPSGTSPASTHPGIGGNLPTCQNCATSTTPLWRRDEMGAVLCNACGLFLKLHGRPRPISLKTDIIKSRNRVKTMRPDLVKQKKQQQQQQQQQQQHNHNLSGTDLNGGDPNNIRRQSQKSVNGHPDDTNSPISRTGTPNMYNSHIAPIYHNIDDSFQSQQLPGFSVNATSPGRAPSPMNGERLDIPPSQEQLMALNASLKTRVSELEVIQELYRGRLQQLEQEENMRLTQTQEPAKAEAQLRAQLDTLSESHTQLQKELEESHRRENMLKRRLDELEEELKGAKESLEVHESDRHKKQRIEEPATLADVAAATTTPPSET